ncbi:hypothetical protein D0Z67_11985 [Streptomyces seoulensis]|uniref:LPXTG cell wall anchor domain-containing protein n=1 Tax=Streptomyces seoulensis TaxID=73044 RepID=A0A4P6TVS9_STRSO|nr:hypothetical protein [Streptomyces seoulensis]QBJ90957.1 hypothetical protein D0Z67_11985 [Streptomyces seoulensis]
MSSLGFRRNSALRAGFVAASLAATVLLPAGAAFAADGATASPQAATPAPSGTPSTEVGTPTSTTKPSTPATTAPTTPAPTSTEGPNGQQGPVLVHTIALKGDLTAKVYKHTDQGDYYSATITFKGKTLGELRAGGSFGAQQMKVFNGIKVTLRADGSMTSADEYVGNGGQGPVVPVRCVVTVTRNIGAGTEALMTISPTGPSVEFRGAGETKLLPYTLTRLHPKLPASAGFEAEILGPNSTHPRLRTNMEGGGHPATIQDFPQLPKGCNPFYPTTSTGSAGSTGTTTTGHTSTNQTTVVPKGSVAAGYESTQGSDAPVLMAVGGAAAGAAGLGFVVLRRRGTSVAGRI